MYGSLVQSTLELAKGVNLRKDATTSGITHATGLLGYDLELLAKQLVPEVTPFRNRVPRIGRRGLMQGDAAHWKAITAINAMTASQWTGTSVMSQVSEGNRGALITTTEKDFVATYKGLGLENSVSFEPEYGSEGWDDARAIATRTLLTAMMIGEEQQLLWGNTGNALGTTPTPVGTLVTGGAMTSGTAVQVFCVALTYLGFMLDGGAIAPAAAATAIVDTVAKTNAGPVSSSDTINGGHAIISATSTAKTPTGGTLSVSWKVTSVPGAVAYAWFVGTTGTAATSYLEAITTTNVWLQTANAVGSANQAGNFTGAGSDRSTNALDYDGFISLIIQGGGYQKSLDGATLTSDNSGGIVEIDAVLQALWDTRRTGPTGIMVNSQQANDIYKKVMAGGSSGSFRLVAGAADGRQGISGGSIVREYVNKFGMGNKKVIPIEIHPNMPSGTIFFDCNEVPSVYTKANVPGPYSVRTRQDYYSVEWPRYKRQYEYGVYCDSCPQVYIPFAFGILSNVGAG